MDAIHGETLGLLGFGNIARAQALRGKVLGMEVIAYDPFVKASEFAERGGEAVALEELAARSDCVSYHVPLNDKTRGMINATFFHQMKPSAYFINTSRGPVVDETALITAFMMAYPFTPLITMP